VTNVFRAKARTFWFAALWGVVSLLLILSIVGILLGLLSLFGLGIWIAYRVARGWLALRDKRPMYL